MTEKDPPPQLDSFRILLYLLMSIFGVAALLLLVYDHQVEPRNHKMIARSWDPLKPRWLELIRVASGSEISVDGVFQNLTYPDCAAFEVHNWTKINVADHKWLEKYQMNGTVFHRKIFAMILPSQDIASVLCPPSTFLGQKKPMDFNQK